MEQITRGTFAVFSFDHLRDFSPEASKDNCGAGINSGGATRFTKPQLLTWHPMAA
jgi:hypothetical protein